MISLKRLSLHYAPGEPPILSLHTLVMSNERRITEQKDKDCVVDSGVRFRDFGTSIEGALNDEEPGVSKPIYAEGLCLGDTAEILNLNRVGSCLPQEDVIAPSVEYPT